MQKIAEEYGNFFEIIHQETTVQEYEKFFDTEATFEDPFQKVKGINAIYKVFARMYETLYEPKFIIDEVVANGNIAYIRWKFDFATSKSAEKQSFLGVSRVEFNESNKVISHIDYWDAAFNVYEKIPLLGSVLRFIKRKLHA